MTLRRILKPSIFLALSALLLSRPVFAEEVGCATTTWKLIGANHRVCVYAYDDPKISGVTCHVSQARTGGVKGSLGLAEDPSQFSIACRQIGPITLPAKLPEDEVVFSEDTSIFFKETNIHRFLDKSGMCWFIWPSVARLSKAHRPTRFRRFLSSHGPAIDRKNTA
jgi:CreA protein